MNWVLQEGASAEDVGEGSAPGSPTGFCSDVVSQREGVPIGVPQKTEPVDDVHIHVRERKLWFT